jgi:Phage portal protein, SPP1 Gp6-like
VSVLALSDAPRAAGRTALDWRDVLLRRLSAQAARVALYDDYYDGMQRLQFTTAKYREAFGGLFGAFADNWCQIVVDAAVERLRIVGFQVGGEPSADAWGIWQRNGLDVESVIAHTEAGKCGQAFLLVAPNGGEPLITVEHASQMVVATDPGDRGRRLAALKHWDGEDGFLYLTLYLPEVVLRFEAPSDTVRGLAPIEWQPRSDVDPETPNPLGVVPVIPLENKPGLLGAPHSDLEPALSLQDAVNKLCSDMVIASEYGAFPQRVITGWQVPTDPATGEPLLDRTELKAAMSRLWTFAKPDVKATSLPAADLSNFTNAIEMFIQHLAAQTRTPPHYLLARLVNTSGDALSVAEAGLVSKCRAKQLFFSDAWEEAVALALTAAGTGTDKADCETIWSNPERQTPAQLTDAALKKRQLGLPLEVIWLELGYTPQQIESMAELEVSQREQALADIAAAAAAKVTERLQGAPPTQQTQPPAPPGTPPLTGGTGG